ncbi:MAG: repeat-associated core domain protein, partial [Paenibacillus sp.]|nr:repeat-associated core domain protein [Paenibacillus sp.]
MDQMVYTAQQWLNTTYGSNPKYNNLFPEGISENGVTGQEVEQALIAALQIELGIASPTGTFGPATISAFTQMSIRSSGDLTTPTNKEYILQGGFWCKGYNPGGWTGIFYTDTQEAVNKFQADAGLTNCDGVVNGMIMKAILNTDPFVLASNGDLEIRHIQQSLNNKYKAYTGLLPTNGIYVRQTNTALIYALQCEEGMSTSVANGYFGAGTTSKCPTLSLGDTRTNYVFLLQYALYCNGYSSGVFDGIYDSEVKSTVENFQSFMELPVTGIANMPTIKATMASCGDTNRAASTCDCATILTTEKAATLKNNGYQVVGRYLTGTVGGVSKALTSSEVKIIHDAGLRFFPIYEANGTHDSYFTPERGDYDAASAITASENLGVPSESVIYFAVDYDAMDYEVTDYILPYFQAVKSYFDAYSAKNYLVGIYGARNICSRVCDSGFAVSSFVADMSTGYSGNLGYTMPANWAYDQFTTVSIGSGSGQIEIDKNGYSSRYSGVDHVVKSSNTSTENNEPPVQPPKATHGDPVDTSTGAHLLQVMALKVTGAQDLSFDLSYNSSKLSIGSMGKGWSHNFEIQIQKVYDSLLVYWTPSDFTTFAQNSEGIYTCSALGKQNDFITLNEDGSYLLNRSNDMKYFFNSSGNLTNIENRVGMSLSVSKNTSTGDLIITEPISGQTLTAHYNTFGFMDQVSDQSGRVVVFSYDSNACLTMITMADGKTASYTYDSVGRVMTSSDGEGVICFTNVFDELGRVISQEDAIGGKTLFSYDDSSINGELIVTITNRNGDTLQNIFNSSTRQLLSATDENGNTTMYEYDINGNVSSVTDALGNVTTASFNSRNQPLTQTDPEGAVTVKTYDDRGNLLSVLNPDGGETTNTYESSNRVITMIDTRECVTTYVYDTNGLLVEKDVGTQKTSYSYFNGLLKTITDPRGMVTTNSYDLIGRLISVSDTGGSVTEYTYDAVDNQLTIRDALNHIMSFTYNSRGLMLTQTDANGNKISYQYNGNGKLMTVTDPKGNSTSYTYDDEDRVIQIEDAQGNRTQLTYDPAGRMLNQMDPLGRVSSFTYDAVGNILSTTKPSGGVSTNTYYKNGKMKTETDTDGNTTTYFYDGAGRLINTTNSLNKVTKYDYNQAGDLLSVTDPLNHKTQYTYDLFGNSLTKVDPNGNVTTYSYDLNNNMISEKDALGNMITYGYDEMNQLKMVTDANNHTSSITYDALGRAIEKIDALGHKSVVSYDPNGNSVQQMDALGNITRLTTYDATNLPTIVQDALGNKITNTYNVLGRLTQVEDPLNHQTLYAYDASSQLITGLDALSGESSSSYDADGNEIKVKNPLGGIRNSVYDHSDRLVSESTSSYGVMISGFNSINLISQMTNARNQQRMYLYDDAGRISSFTDQEGTTAYTYDANGNILTVTDTSGTITRQYDALNRVIKYTDVNGFQIQYAYDPAGNLSSMTYPDGKDVHYTYDEANQLISVTDWENRMTIYTYDAPGNLIKTEKPDGSVLIQTYDAAGKPISATDKDNAGNLIIGYNYTYDANGQIITEESLNDQITSTMSYDALGRLISKSEKNTSGSIVNSFTYSYDANGNVTSANSIQQSAAMIYSIDDQLNSYNGQSTAYDLDGNMTVCTINGDMLNFYYDSGNRLIRAGDTIYAYNAEDHRISTTDAGYKTQYVYENVAADLSQMLVRIDSNGNQTYFIYGLGLIGHEDANGYSTYHFDFRGSTVALTNELSTVTDRYTYGPYGELLTHWGTSDTFFLYNGREGVATDTNGLYYMRARYYVPEIKRFTNADPVYGSISASQTLNRYAYVTGDPILLVDPQGNWAGLDDLIAMGVGAAAGVTTTFVGDLITVSTGHGGFSDWQTYVGNAVGGALGGELAIYTGNPWLIGAASGFTSEITTEALENISGKISGIDVYQLAKNTILGSTLERFGEIRIKGITSGRNSYKAVYKSGLKKIKNGKASKMSPKVIY